MQVTVRYFASIRVYTGLNREMVELSTKSTINDLLELLASKYDDFGDLRVLAAVNGEYAVRELVLSDEDVVALFPPVSGG